MLMKSLKALIRNDLGILERLEGELSEQGLYPLTEMDKIEDTTIKMFAISVLKDYQRACEHILHTILKEFDRAADLSREDVTPCRSWRSRVFAPW